MDQLKAFATYFEMASDDWVLYEMQHWTEMG